MIIINKTINLNLTNPGEIIYEEMKDGNVMMSRRAHDTGSDRIAEAIENLDCDVILNVQGEEPFIDSMCLSIY